MPKVRLYDTFLGGLCQMVAVAVTVAVVVAVVVAVAVAAVGGIGKVGGVNDGW